MKRRQSKLDHPYLKSMTKNVGVDISKSHTDVLFTIGLTKHAKFDKLLPLSHHPDDTIFFRYKDVKIPLHVFARENCRNSQFSGS